MQMKKGGKTALFPVIEGLLLELKREPSADK
jgi:hypothetical protein